MMTTIGRNEFLRFFSSGSIDINNLSVEAADLLARAGVDKSQIEKVAGQDGVITGRAEAKDLYAFIEDYDHNGSMGSLETSFPSEGVEVLTGSGELHEALKAEVLQRQRDAQIRGLPGSSSPVVGNTRKAGSLEGMTPDSDLAATKDKLAEAGFTDVHITSGTVYFGQAGKYNMEYPRTPPVPGEDRWLRDAGCGPTSLAMIDATLRPDANTTPEDVANFAIENGLSGTYDPETGKKESTSVRQLVRKWTKAVGLEPQSFEVGSKGKEISGKDAVDRIRAQVETGGLALISVGPDHFTEHGHIMVINGYAKDADGKEWFFVANPGKQGPEKVRYKDGVVVDGDLAHGAGKVRVRREVLEKELKYGFTFDPEKKS